MIFRTELALSPSPVQLSLHSKILTVGSCFAEVIGNQLKSNKFEVMNNPFGVIFNPVSITRLVEATLAGNQPDQHSMVQLQERWYHYDLHSRISAPSASELTALLLRLFEETRTFLHQTDWLLLTFGSAFVYRLKETNQIVANCHKVPAASFSKELLSVTQVKDAVSSLCKQLFTIRPDLRVILTISPVRHIKDGIAENQLSKSILRVACHEIATQSGHITYFPSYEIMMDDLRDYRFYKKDMIHPSEVAEEYIWGKFADVFVDDQAKVFIKEWGSIRQALAHQSFHPEAPAHQAFLKQTLSKLQQLNRQVDVAEEIRNLELKIKN